jgi:hypothetical protein
MKRTPELRREWGRGLLPRRKDDDDDAEEEEEEEEEKKEAAVEAAAAAAAVKAAGDTRRRRKRSAVRFENTVERKPTLQYCTVPYVTTPTVQYSTFYITRRIAVQWYCTVNRDS